MGQHFFHIKKRCSQELTATIRIESSTVHSFCFGNVRNTGNRHAVPYIITKDSDYCTELNGV